MHNRVRSCPTSQKQFPRSMLKQGGKKRNRKTGKRDTPNVIQVSKDVRPLSPEPVAA
jgi:hypothetical protein